MLKIDRNNDSLNEMSESPEVTQGPHLSKIYQQQNKKKTMSIWMCVRRR